MRPVLHHHSAVDNDNLAGYVGCLIRCKKHHGRGNVLDLPQTLERDQAG